MSVNPLTPRMMRMPGFSGVAASQTAVLQLPVGGPTYHSLFLNVAFGGTPATSAQIDSLVGRLKLNGTVIYEIVGSLERPLNAYYGHAHVDGVLPILFSRPTARTPSMDTLTAIGTGNSNVSQLTLEIDLPATANPSISCEAEVSDVRRPVNYIIRRQVSRNVALQSGQNTITNLPVDNGALIGLHFNGSVVTGIDAELNGRPIIQATPATLAHRQLIVAGGRTPQTNWVHVDPCARDNYNSRIELVTPQGKDFRALPTASAGGNVNIVIDTLYAPFGIQPEPAGVA